MNIDVAAARLTGTDRGIGLAVRRAPRVAGARLIAPAPGTFHTPGAEGRTDHPARSA